jgi:hypothetical protein
MASPRTVAVALAFLVLVAASSPTSVVRARMMPAVDGVQDQVIGDGEVTTGASSSLQEALVQRPPLPLPMSSPAKTKPVFAPRSSRMLGSVPSPGVGH